MTFETSTTSENFNSYVTVSEADAALANKSFNTSKWSALSSEKKQDILIQASSDLNGFKFKGVVDSNVKSVYGMIFPRDNFFLSNGVKVETIPFFVKEYVYQRAVERITYDQTKMNKVTVPSNVKSTKLDTLSTTFKDNKEIDVSLRDFQSFMIIKQYVLNSPSTVFLRR